MVRESISEAVGLPSCPSSGAGHVGLTLSTQAQARNLKGTQTPLNSASLQCTLHRVRLGESPGQGEQAKLWKKEKKYTHRGATGTCKGHP